MFKLKTLLGAFICGVLALGTGIGLNVTNNLNSNAEALNENIISLTFSKANDTGSGYKNREWNINDYTFIGNQICDNGSKVEKTFQGKVGSYIYNENPFETAISSVSIRVPHTGTVSATSNFSLNFGTMENTFNTSVMFGKDTPYNMGSKGSIYTINNDVIGNGMKYFKLDFESGTSYIAEIQITLELSVIEGELNKIDYTGVPVPQHAGQTFNAEGLTFIAVYTDGEKYLSPDELTYSPYFIESNTKEVVATYDTKSVLIPVTVVNESQTEFIFGSLDEFNRWDSSYDERTLKAGDISFFWDAANKQTTTITTMPVTKEGTLVVTSGTRAIKSIKISFEQWASKSKTITASYPGHDDVATLTIPDLENANTLTVNIPEDGVYEVSFNAPGSNQVGWEKAIIEFYDVNPDIVVIREFIELYMHTEIPVGDNSDTNACLGADGYYAKAKEAFNALTAEQRRIFIENVLFTDMYARLSAWARANQETFDASTNMLVSANVNTNNVISNEGYLTVIIAVSMLAVSLIAIFAFTKKKAIHR